MKANEKVKAQKVINKIQAGSFDENDIDTLFMKLRAYSKGHPVFLEAADFVAHNDVRDRGLMNESLEGLYLSLKFFLDHGYQNKQFDYRSPFPLYIKKLMKHQASKCRRDELKQRFNVTPEGLKARINALFKDNRETKTTELRNDKVSKEDLAPVDHVLRYIFSEPAFSVDDLMRELLSVLRMNKLAFDENAVLAQKPTIILCVMLLIHQTTFPFEEKKTGKCCIGVDRSRGTAPDYGSQTFGTIDVQGMVDIVRPDGRPMTVAFPILQSGLLVSDYCDPSLFNNGVVPQTLDLCVSAIDLDGNLLLTDDQKLGRG